ncbi:glycogen/starch/alpha-glucan phosphorylase [Propionispora vibrioides]|uniref:Alpha-1,4 glucan phosphorylase n=1 Tax=Propionispora vibrioides TaxID=112903 RepID=A0A1H8Q2X6_9FIRM|nr:glycogen/starch/alpha-glucan phosphorylase [Propionispora vibrioides]SEO48331.1 starch phosphorylase [Propionispora vibrioides]
MNFDKAGFKNSFINQLQSMYGKGLEEADLYEQYMAFGACVREVISQNWIRTRQQYRSKNEKQVFYFSMEFLLGKLLDMYLIHLGLKEPCRQALAELGIDLAALAEAEPDAGLGNGGLGRLAACLLDSMAAMHLPGHGCGIRYKYGLFEQKIVDHHQVELPDNWLKNGYIWEYRKADKTVEVRFGGRITQIIQPDKWMFVHEDYEPVLAVPYDIPIVGYQNRTVNTLRLWSAEPAAIDFDLSSFNRGDYSRAVEYRHSVERISKILYPDDTHYEGRLLRLKQQYFFVSAGLQSILHCFKQRALPWRTLPEKVGVHINDTHPALAIPELMRLLIDEAGLGWEEAWNITVNTISYTNHTTMPEALEKWPVDMLEKLLPRIYLIIQEIHERLCRTVWDKTQSWDAVSEIAIIADGQVHMARLAVVGSYSVNGVAQIHSEILKNHTFAGFSRLYPYKFNNKTNGITHRRWLIKSNPALAELISRTIDSSWIKYPCDLIQLVNYAQDESLQQQFAAIKRQNKLKLAQFISNKYDIQVDVDSIFDVQVKRLHAYKRQILNVLHIMHLYNKLRENPQLDMVPRTFIFAGKAAPGYYIAKQTIKLIHVLAEKINHDTAIQGKLKVVFLENYSVSLAEMIISAADVSEQISTASKEASGTGNMKFMMNGAITIGTMDGANIEIKQAVGDANIVIFGLTAKQVFDYYHYGGYSAWDMYHNDPRIKTVMEQLVDGFFQEEREEFRPLYNDLLHNNDEFFVLKDFAAYCDAQRVVENKFRHSREWQKMALMNIAHSGIFSSDRMGSEYSVGIWKIKPVIITG